MSNPFEGCSNVTFNVLKDNVQAKTENEILQRSLVYENEERGNDLVASTEPNPLTIPLFRTVLNVL